MVCTESAILNQWISSDGGAPRVILAVRQMNLGFTDRAGHAEQRGFSLVEVMVAVFVLGLLVLSLFGAFSWGLGVVHAARDNLRATQILTQKMETIRLFRWSQLTNKTNAPPLFSALYDPSGTNAGTVYQGRYASVQAPSDIPAAYRDNMRLVTIDVYWTNYYGASKVIVQKRQVQTLVAQYGIQPYVYQQQ